MCRVLILHVGPHKTGTTYIQKRLVEDRDLLHERLRLVYPRTGQTVLFGHHALVPVFREAGGGLVCEGAGGPVFEPRDQSGQAP